MARNITILVAADARRAISELNRTGRAVNNLGGQSSKTGRALRAGLVLGSRAAIAGTAGLAVGLGYAIKQAAGFQTQLNVLKAVSGATGDQMKRISALSIQLGNDVKLPATSAADAALAMTELAKGGLGVQDAMRAARGSLELAAAGETDVGTAASITATTLNQFGLAGAQATKVADLLAGAANASAGNVTDFAEGLQYAGTAAHAAGQSVTLTVAALAEMANAGLSGSVAGTSLANALRALQAPTASAQEAMDKYKLSIYDAAGNMKPLNEISDIFTEQLGSLTQEQQNATLAQIFGTRSVQAARIVFLHGGDALDEYAKKVGKAGNAQRLAESRMKGFSGAMQAFQSQVETLAIQIGLKLLPVATDVVNGLSGLIEQIERIFAHEKWSVRAKLVWQGVREAAGNLWDQFLEEWNGPQGGPRKPLKVDGKNIQFENMDPAEEGWKQQVKDAWNGIDWSAVLTFSGEDAGIDIDWGDIFSFSGMDLGDDNDFSGAITDWVNQAWEGIDWGGVIHWDDFKKAISDIDLGPSLIDTGPIKRSIRSIGDAVGFVVDAFKTARRWGGRAADWIRDRWNSLPSVTDLVRGAIDLATDAFRTARRWGGRAADFIRDRWEDMRPVIDAVSGIIDTITGAFKTVRRWGQRAADGISSAFDNAAGWFGPVLSAVQTVIDALRTAYDTARNILGLGGHGVDPAPNVQGLGRHGAIVTPGQRHGASAVGSRFWRGGATLVGERGAELVSLPRGSVIHTAKETKRMIESGTPTYVTNNITMTEADPGVVAARIGWEMRRRGIG